MGLAYTSIKQNETSQSNPYNGHAQTSNDNRRPGNGAYHLRKHQVVHAKMN